MVGSVLSPSPSPPSPICSCHSRLRYSLMCLLQIKPPPCPAGRFTQVLSVGIGGSALGPQFVSEALAGTSPPLQVGTECFLSARITKGNIIISSASLCSCTS